MGFILNRKISLILYALLFQMYSWTFINELNTLNMSCTWDYGINSLLQLKEIFLFLSYCLDIKYYAFSYMYSCLPETINFSIQPF